MKKTPKPLEQLLRDQKTLLRSYARPAAFGLALVSKAEIRSLNREYRGKNSPTDVLSFPAPVERFPGTPVDYRGEVVICTDVARTQAREQGHALRDELRILLVHGFLHLLGYDHELNAREAARMQKRENLMLKKLGWSQGLISRVESTIKKHKTRTKK